MDRYPISSGGDDPKGEHMQARPIGVLYLVCEGNQCLEFTVPALT